MKHLYLTFSEREVKLLQLPYQVLLVANLYQRRNVQGVEQSLSAQVRQYTSFAKAVFLHLLTNNDQIIRYMFCQKATVFSLGQP